MRRTLLTPRFNQRLFPTFIPALFQYASRRNMGLLFLPIITTYFFLSDEQRKQFAFNGSALIEKISSTGESVRRKIYEVQLSRINVYEQGALRDAREIGITVSPSDFFSHKDVLDTWTAVELFCFLLKQGGEFHTALNDIAALKKLSIPDERVNAIQRHGLPVVFAKSFNDTQIQLFQYCAFLRGNSPKGKYDITPEQIARLRLANTCKMGPLEDGIAFMLEQKWPWDKVVALVNDGPKTKATIDLFGAAQHADFNRRYVEKALGSLRWRAQVCEKLNLPLDKLGAEFHWIKSQDAVDVVVAMVKNQGRDLHEAATAIKHYDADNLRHALFDCTLKIGLSR